MSYLFVDTSNQLTFGLLDDEFKWIDYVQLEDKRSSAKIHSKIYEMLESQGLKAKEVKAVFQISGPGSYTGMRVSEGLAQVFQWQNIPAYSFYHFEIPKMLNIESGIWISNAFKGELFVYSWDGEKSTKKLQVCSEFSKQIEEFKSIHKNVYTHFSSEFEVELACTSDIIQNSPREVFKYVLDSKMVNKPFYYRSLEQEFKTSKK